MKLGKLLVLLLGLGVVAWAAKTQLDGAASRGGQHSQPQRQLDNVRDASRRIEADAQKRADEVDKKPE